MRVYESFRRQEGLEVTDLIPVRSVWRRRDAHPPQRRLITSANWGWVAFLPLEYAPLGHGGCTIASLLDNIYMESSWCRISVELPDGTRT